MLDIFFYKSKSALSAVTPIKECSDEGDCAGAFAELNQEFSQELYGRLVGLQQLVPLAADGSDDAVEQIIAECHRLRGTAAIFGQSMAGHLLGDVEDSLVMEALAMPVDSLIWSHVDTLLLSALKSAIRH